MDIITYEGKRYWRSSAKWADKDGIIVHERLQEKLNAMFLRTLDPTQMKMEELLSYGDKFKNSGSPGAAIRFFETASLQADKSELAYILPRLTSCYRIQGSPQKAIDILSFASKKYGEQMITPALLVSAAAAYCDLNQYELAKKAYDRAFAKLNGKATDELRAVYGRIRKESNIYDIQ